MASGASGGAGARRIRWRRPGRAARRRAAPARPTCPIEAKNIAFVETTFTAPAGKPFTIAFDNEDPGTPHNVEIKDASGAVVFKGEIFNGVATQDLRRPGPDRRLVHVRVHRPSDA